MIGGGQHPPEVFSERLQCCRRCSLVVDFVERIDTDIRDLSEGFLVDIVRQFIDRIVFTNDRVVVFTASHPDYPKASRPQSRLEFSVSRVPDLQAELERCRSIEPAYSWPIPPEQSK